MSTQKALINFIDDVIRDNSRDTGDGYELSWEDIDIQDRQQIVALMIDNDDRDLFSIYENEKVDDIVSTLLLYLKKDDRDAEEDFAQCVKNNVMKYYESRASELLDERLVDVEREDRWEAGMSRRQDRSSGEMYWSRI